MDKKTILIIFLALTNVATLAFLLLQNDITKYSNTQIADKSNFAGIEAILSGLENDADFYKRLDTYSALLSDGNFEYMEKIGDKLEDENFFQERMILTIVAILFQKDEKFKNIIEELKNTVSSKKPTEEEKENLFSKNNDCAKLVSGIQEQLKNKYKSSFGVTEKEELDFIFYSPTQKTCIYSTSYEYTNSKADYYSKYLKIVYDASVQSKLKEYTTYVYNHSYLTDEDTKKDKREYIKFILENSGYNAELLKDFSYGIF